MSRIDAVAHVAPAIACGDEVKKPPRNPNVPCPDCGGKWLYTDFYDQCYECGRHIGSETSARSAAEEPNSSEGVKP